MKTIEEIAVSRDEFGLLLAQRFRDRTDVRSEELQAFGDEYFGNRAHEVICKYQLECPQIEIFPDHKSGNLMIIRVKAD